MKNIQVFIVVLLLIVVLCASLRAYKIENFAELQSAPLTANDMTCYNYLKNIKKWNLSQLNKDQLKVLFTMRAMQGSQFSADNKVFPFKDGCVLPKEHFPVFNKAEEDLSPMTVYPPTQLNKNTCTNPSDKNTAPPRAPLSPYVTLPTTDVTEYPAGVKADFTKMDYEQFKDFLQGAYELYDSDFLKDKRSLEAEIARLEKVRDMWISIRDNYNATRKEYEQKLKVLLDTTSCLPDKRYNRDVLQPEYNRYTDQANSIINNINTLWGYIWEGWLQIWNLQRC